jgi:thymidine phosphorylase
MSVRSEIAPSPQEIIRRKRDGHELGNEEIVDFVQGLTEGRISEGQIAAFAMAVFFRGLSLPECLALARSMARSGAILDWPSLPGPILDKHSTGGVGDKVSLILAPLVAACGGFVPMIAGRGLDHSGGTIDKLESIPGYRTQPSLEKFRRAVFQAGCAIIGQTPELAPADRKLYAIRDVTATVESIPLITASILSKKLAEGLNGLVMDVKLGSGAFMTDRVHAQELARNIVDVAHHAGLRAVALLTDMDQVLGTTAGNAVEVAEAIAFLTQKACDRRLAVVTLALATEMLLLGGLATDEAAALAQLTEALDSGEAAERFARMVRALGGPADLLMRPAAHLPAAPHRLEARPMRPGFVTRFDVRKVGLAVAWLGGGRHRIEDHIDHAVGLTEIAPLGAAVDAGRPLTLIHARDTLHADRAARLLAEAFSIGDAPPAENPAVIGRIGAATEAETQI